MSKPAFFVISIFVVLALLMNGGSVQAGQALSPAYLEGTFVTIWGDWDSGSNATETAYFLATPQMDTIQLEIPTHLLVAAGGSTALNRKTVAVQGTWLESGKSLSVQSLALVEGESPVPEGVYGPQPWVSILCKFADYADEPKNLSYFQGMYSIDYPGLDHYWREQSFNLANLEGSGAFGWYVLPQPRSYYVYDDQLDWGRAAVDCTAVADNDVYFLDYVGINLMFNANLDCCAWGGSWNLFLEGEWHTYRMTWEPPWGYENIGVIGHETGHGFGLPHSYWNPARTYDNKWDVMSDVWSNGDRGGTHPVYGTLGQHTISYHKDMLGWIEADQMAVIRTGETMTMTLERLALPQSDNFLGARILVDNSPSHFLTVEARRLTGYDSWLPPITYGLPGGVVLHDIHVYAGMPARVIDIDKNGDTGDLASMWEPGETYITPTLGIEMSVIAATETGYVVNISNRYTPMDSVDITGPAAGALSESVTFTATISPEDVVPPITYAWQASGHDPITNTGGLFDSVSFEWSQLGTQVITVTASNPYQSRTDTYSIPIMMPPSNLEITGSEEADLVYTSTFTATVTPITTTVPLTYHWFVDEQLVFTHTSGITDTVTLNWGSPGPHIVSAKAVNAVGDVSDSWSVAIFVRVYLPAGYKN